MKSYQEFLEDLEEYEDLCFRRLEEEEERERKKLIDFLNKNNLAHYKRENIKKYLESTNYDGIATKKEIEYYFNLL